MSEWPRSFWTVTMSLSLSKSRVLGANWRLNFARLRWLSLQAPKHRLSGTTQHTGLGYLVNPTQRRYHRFPVKIPILVNGVDKTGRAFRLAAETLKVASMDWACFLPKSQVLPPRCWSPFLIMTLDTNQMLVGVRFRGIHDLLPAPSNSELAFTEQPSLSAAEPSHSRDLPVPLLPSE
jgi:hypothetical protein